MFNLISLINVFYKKSNSLKEENSHHLDYDKKRNDHMTHIDHDAINKCKADTLGKINDFIIYMVDAEIIRDAIDMDFTTGGNPARYSYIPNNEIWIENTMHVNDIFPTIVHEYLECFMMQKHHYSYNRAHDFANETEFKIRDKISKNKLNVKDNKQGLLFANKIINKVLDI